MKSGGNCKFIKLRSNFAYYEVEFYRNDGNYYSYYFTIPLEDIGNATLNAEEKPITLMRWIRKALENNELILTRYTVPDLKPDLN